MVTGRSLADVAVTIDDVRQIVGRLERSYEVVVRDRVKFRVGSIVYLAFSEDDTIMGFGFPKEEREALVAARPETMGSGISWMPPSCVQVWRVMEVTGRSLADVAVTIDDVRHIVGRLQR